MMVESCVFSNVKGISSSSEATGVTAGRVGPVEGGAAVVGAGVGAVGVGAVPGGPIPGPVGGATGRTASGEVGAPGGPGGAAPSSPTSAEIIAIALRNEIAEMTILILLSYFFSNV